MRTKNKRRYYINKKRLIEKRNATKIKNTQINYRQEILKDNPYLAEKVGCGYQDFQDFACGRQFYVDKTHFITEWLQSEAKVTLITRPRRFGKTTLLSTVENFLDPKFSDHPEHFEKFKVWRDDKSREWFGKMIGDIIRKYPARSKYEIEQLMKGAIVHKKINEHITFQYLDGDENSLWSLLLAVGYIKADNVKKCGEITECDVSVTNQEVMEMFRYEILAMFENGNAVYHDFVEALLSHRTEELTDILMDISYTSMSYFDVGRRPSERAPENFYHGLVLGLIVSLRDRYRIVSNRESGRGRYDIAMYPLSEGEDAFIIEFKVCDEKEDGTLEKAAENALRQIEEKRYDADLLAAGIAEEHIYKLGIAFAGKDVAVKSARRVDEELL